jgi:hypothetical protein
MEMSSELLENLLKQKKIIYSYIRTSDLRKKIGMLVAWKDNQNNICVSYSLLNPGDTFNKLQGLQQAMDKFYSSEFNSYLLSESKAMMLDYQLAFSFIRRTLQYFKNSNFSVHFPVLKREIHAESQS